MHRYAPSLIRGDFTAVVVEMSNTGFGHVGEQFALGLGGQAVRREPDPLLAARSPRNTLPRRRHQIAVLGIPAAERDAEPGIVSMRESPRPDLGTATRIVLAIESL